MEGTNHYLGLFFTLPRGLVNGDCPSCRLCDVIHSQEEKKPWHNSLYVRASSHEARDEGDDH
jgi:hypothetical protein